MVVVIMCVVIFVIKGVMLLWMLVCCIGEVGLRWS